MALLLEHVLSFKSRMPEGETQWPEQHGDWRKRESDGTPISVFRLTLQHAVKLTFYKKMK